MKDISLDEFHNNREVEDMLLANSVTRLHDRVIINIDVGSLSQEDAEKVVKYYKDKYKGNK